MITHSVNLEPFYINPDHLILVTQGMITRMGNQNGPDDIIELNMKFIFEIELTVRMSRKQIESFWKEVELYGSKTVSCSGMVKE